MYGEYMILFAFNSPVSKGIIVHHCAMMSIHSIINKVLLNNLYVGSDHINSNSIFI